MGWHLFAKQAARERQLDAELRFHLEQAVYGIVSDFSCFCSQVALSMNAFRIENFLNRRYISFQGAVTRRAFMAEQFEISIGG